MKKRIILLFILVIIVLSGLIAYRIILKTNSNVKKWHEFPTEEKVLSCKLSLEMLAHNIIKPSIDEKAIEAIGPESLEQSIIMGADWLVSVQEPNGRFKYQYDLDKKQFCHKNMNNFLRQAGAAYGLTQAYEVTGNIKYLESARRSLLYQFNSLETLDTNKAYFLYRNEAKLGGIAIPMLTMLRIKSIENDSIYDKKLKKLANMIIYLQQKNSDGQFKHSYVLYGDYDYEKNNNWECNIYPGEAMLALALMFKEFGDVKYKDSFDAAFGYYKKHGRWRNTGFSSWAISAFSELYKVTGDKTYADFTFKMCDHRLKLQNLNPKRKEYGSLNPLPSIFSSISFEGIGEAIAVCQLTGDDERYNDYKYRSLIAYKWLMSLQYKGEDKRAYGSFQKNWFNNEIRIDNVQHSISAMSIGLKIIYQKQKLDSNQLVNETVQSE